MFDKASAPKKELIAIAIKNRRKNLFNQGLGGDNKEQSGDGQTIKHEIYENVAENAGGGQTNDLAPAPKTHKFDGIMVSGKRGFGQK